MQEEKFKIREGQGFIKLNALLKVLGWAMHGGEANQIISEGLVKLNGEIETQKRKKIKRNDLVEFQDNKVVLE